MEFLSVIIAFFATLHWDVLLKIIGIDILLGVDNAIVIAMAVSALAVEQRNKAIILGTAGAILARIVFLFAAFWLMGLPVVKLIAGAYLVYLAYGMISASGDSGGHEVKKSTTLLGAATTIVIADIAMSLDNALALVGASEGTGDHAFGYTVFGILLSIPIIIFASKFLISLLDKFPILVWGGAGLIAWVGTEMMLKESVVHNFIVSMNIPHVLIASAVTAATLGAAWLVKDKSDNSNNLLQN